MHWQYVTVGYAFVLTGIAAYAYAVVRRGRRLSEQVPEDERRYLD